MGYIAKDIAIITEPKEVSLVANPNFVIFESKPGQKTFLEVEISVRLTPALVGLSTITVVDSLGENHTFTGTTEAAESSGTTFYISDGWAETTQNIRDAILSDSFMRSNFDIDVSLSTSGGTVSPGSEIRIKSKGTGKPYNISLSAAPLAYAINWVNSEAVNDDSISGEDIETEIELEVYENTAVPLGADDLPPGPYALGDLFATIQKTYTGAPLWFELNTLIAKKVKYNAIPKDNGWFDTGTLFDYRFSAKVKNISSTPFYYSNVLYALKGYGYALNPTDVIPYIYTGDNVVKLLTNTPLKKYVKGQREFINFMLGDYTESNEYRIGVCYKLYTFGGEYIASVIEHEVLRSQLSAVNTCAVNLSGVLDTYPKTGRVDITVVRDGVDISNGLRLEIIPECLHRLNEFIFLNRLGGWDIFNADTETEEENKQSSSTYTKTHIPGLRVGDSLESVYDVEMDTVYSLETLPLDATTRLWLKELAASPVIFDGNGNYIILEDFKSPISSEMDTLNLKYRLSDKYNG